MSFFFCVFDLQEIQGWKPGELVFSFQAMPQVGHRPDTSDFENSK